MADTTRTIKIKIDSSGANKKIDKLDGKLTGLSTSLSKVAVAVAAAFAVRPLIKYSDEFKNLQNQLRLVTKGTQNLADVTQELFEVAQKSRTSFTATGELYAKLARSTQELGTSQRDLIRITETINKSFAISGATAQEAENAIRQLGQGLSAGALRGDEFNSVAEQAPGILRAVAAETGKSIGELRAFAAEGKITTDLLVRSLQNYASVVDDEFAQANITISQSTTVFENSFMRLVGVLDEVGGASSGVSSLIVELSGAIDDLSDAVESGAVGEVFSSQFDIISREIGGALDEIRDFYNSILSEAGITSEGVESALRSAFTGYVPTVVASVKATILTLKTLVNFVELSADEISDALGFDFSKLESGLDGVANSFKEFFNSTGEFLKSTVIIEDLTEGFEGLQEAAASTDLGEKAKELNSEYEKQLKLIFATRDADIEATETAITNAQRKLEALRSGGGGGSIDETGGDPTVGGTSADMSSMDDGNARIDALTNRLKRETALIVAENQLRQDIEDELTTVAEAREDARFNREAQRLTDSFVRQNEIITENKELAIETAGTDEEAKREAILLAAEQRAELQAAINAREVAIKEKHEQNLTSIEKAERTLRTQLFAKNANTLLSAIGTIGKKSIKVQKAVALGQAGISIATGIAKAQELGFPLNIAEMVRVAAVGVSAIRSIKGAKIGAANVPSGTAGGGGGGSVSTASAAPVAPVADFSNQVQTLDTGALINELRGLGSEPIPASFAARILEAIPEARQITGEG